MPLGDLAALSLAALSLAALPLVELAVVALAVAGIVVMALAVRRAARALYRARRRGDPAATMAQAGRDLDPQLELVERRVDALRHDQLAPAELIALVSEALDEVAAVSEGVKALQVPPGADAGRDGFSMELLRASRALDSILDACLALEGTTGADRRARAAIVLKWGHLNLMHVRQSLAEQVGQLEEVADARRSRWRTSRI